MSEMNHYFDPAHPLKPYTHSLVANPGTSPPGHAVRGEEPAALAGFWPCWNGQAWEQVEDHRGQAGWLDGQALTITELGPLPTGWSGQAPAPDPAEVQQMLLAEIDAELARLDVEYLTPRVLANLALGDGFARNRQEKHEAEALVLRQKRAEILMSVKGDSHATN